MGHIIKGQGAGGKETRGRSPGRISPGLLHSPSSYAIMSGSSYSGLPAEQESTALAQPLISATCDRQLIRHEQSLLHSDHRSPMTARRF